LLELTQHLVVAKDLAKVKKLAIEKVERVEEIERGFEKVERRFEEIEKVEKT
jgi:hypothetical protein